VLRESYNLETRNVRAAQVDADGPQMQLERLEAETSIGVLDETAPLVEEISIYDTPETRAWKESQRAELDQAIDDLFSASMDEFNLIKPNQGWENPQLRDIHQSAAKLGEERVVAARTVAKRNSEILIQELELRAVRTNEEIVHQRQLKEQSDGRFDRAEEAQERSDALERAEDVPLDGVSDDVCIANKVFDETLNRICEPDHGNLTPRMHPLEEAALAARARARETGESWQTGNSDGGVAVMEPEVITFDPRTAAASAVDPRVSPELALDPRVAVQPGVRNASRVRPMDELRTNYKLAPQPDPQPMLQPLRTKMPMRTEVETVFQDEPRPPRRIPPGGPGGVGEQVQQMMNSPFVLPKHVMTFAALEGKVKKARDHGRPKLLRKTADGRTKEVASGSHDYDAPDNNREVLQLANATDGDRLISSTSDT
jgi:hypothetical protein